MNTQQPLAKLRIFLILLLLFTALLNVIHVTQQWIWHPYDETAHYDYIVHLSMGHLPAADATLSQHTLDVSSGFGAVFTTQHDQLSYEAQQPPVYYLILAMPKALMEAWAVAPWQQVQVLRAFNPIFLLISALLVIAIFQHLQRYYQINALYGYLLAVWMMLPGAIYWTGLNNNYLSLVWNHWAILSLLSYWQFKHSTSLFYAAIAVTLSFLTKYTNGYMVVLMGSIWLIALWQHCQHWKQLQAVLLSATPLLGIAGYLLWNLWQYDDILKIQAVQHRFAEQIHALDNSVDFIYLLMQSLLNLEHLWTLPDFLIWAGFVLLALNSIAIYLKVQLGAWRLTPLLIAVILTGLVIITATLLNFYVPGVYWFNFRHYAGYSIFFYSSLLAIVWLPSYIQAYLLKLASLGLVISISVFAYSLWVNDPPAYHLLVDSNQHCVTLQADYANGSPLTTTTCTGEDTQLWRYHPRFGFLQNKNNLCVDASINPDWRKTDGLRLFIWQCLNSWNHRWLLQGQQFALPEGQCLTTGTTENPWVHLAPCRNLPLQQWQFKAVSAL